MHRNHVSAGTHFVGLKQPLVLEAFLGTCVGVALIDGAWFGGWSPFLFSDEPDDQQALGGLELGTGLFDRQHRHPQVPVVLQRELDQAPGSRIERNLSRHVGT